MRIVESNDSKDDENNTLVESYKDEDKILASDKRPLVGELQVKGDMVFREYHGKSDQTIKSFTKDGWFMTGK